MRALGSAGAALAALCWACGSSPGPASEDVKAPAPEAEVQALGEVELAHETGPDAPTPEVAPEIAPEASPELPGPEASGELEGGPGPEAIAETVETYVAGCGNGQLDPGEACDDGPDNSDTEPNACRTTCALPWCGDGVVDAGEECDDQNANQYDGCKASCQSATALPVPGPGQVILTELMINPAKASDPEGEWIELSNLTDQSLNLGGCELRDGGTDLVPLGNADGLQLIGAQNRLVLGASSQPALNGGAPVKVAYATMLLDNVVDEVELWCGGVLVDGLAWSSLTFAIPSGAALSLDPAKYTAEHNDSPGSWCAGATAYGLGDLGSPGATNPPCPVPDTQIDACTLVESGPAVAYAGVGRKVALRISEPGVTDATPGIDALAGLVVEVGHGASGSDPSAVGWSWAVAGPVAGWNHPTEDGYLGEVLVAAVGAVDAAARASRDGGKTWTLCDGNAVAGYQPEAALQLEVAASPCTGVICDDPPAAACADDGVTLLWPTAPGACVPEGESSHTCAYPSEPTACGAQGLYCQAASCQGAVAMPAKAGELVFAELMVAPLAVASYLGEWVEIANPSPTARNLDGCVLSDTLTDTHTIEGPLVVAPGDVVVLGRSGDPAENGGLSPDHVLYDDVQLKDQADNLTLTCGGVVIDQVSWTAAWKITKGISLALSPYQEDPAANDKPAAWCAGASKYGAGDYGTPGAHNPACPGEETPLDACQVVGASLVTHPAGTLELFEARVWEGGITDQSSKTDTAPGLRVEVGYGAPGAAPATWAWTAAEPAVEWDTTLDPDASPGEDAWLGLLTIPPPGTWTLGFRASADGGHTWAVCDLDGSQNGWKESQAVALVSVASHCYPDPCAAVTSVCQGTLVAEPAAPGVCVLQGSSAACLWEATPVEDCSSYGAICAGGACVDFPPPPAVGGVVITELMVAPAEGPVAEWFELTNPTGSLWDLAGCGLGSSTAPVWTFPGDAAGQLLMEPGERWLLARSEDATPGVVPDLILEGVALPNDAGTLVLSCAGGVVDQVTWDAAQGWHLPAHQAIALSHGWTDAVANDQGWAWCVPATGATPRAQNPWCPPLDAVVDECRLVSPASVSVAAGSTVMVVGEVYDPGTTDATPGVDLAPGLLAEAGWGPDASQASSAAGWTWTPALAYDAYALSGGAVVGSDYYQAHLSPEAPGDHDLAVRFSADGGTTWSYCDLSGAVDGYQPGAAGQLLVEPTACAPNPCLPKASECLGGDLVAYAAPVCVEDAASGAGYACGYESAELSCAAFGLACADGACLGLGMPGAPGDLVVSEVMRDSLDAEPDDAEWVELHNPTSTPFDLRGCVLGDTGADAHTVAGALPVVVPPGGFLVLASQPALPGMEVGYAWSGLVLSNSHDELVVQCGATLVDAVAWTLGWPGGSGAAMQLSLDKLDPVQNDDPASWCSAATSYAPDGSKGSPGTVNGKCP